MSLGSRILEVIKHLGVTKKDFANSLNISPGNLSDWINPNRKSNPTVESLIRIYELHDINLAWLLTGEGDMFLDHSINVKPGANQSESRVAGLEAEIESLKKSISALEEDNKELNHELLDRLKQLINLQGKLIPNGA